jgi:tryptophanyl-tRNA synthetase
MMSNTEKKRMLSGIQPSGDFTIGNYFGAIKNWVEARYEFNCYFCIVDLHALTVPQVPSVLRTKTMECYAMLIAAGLNPEHTTLFIQSHVSAHSELAWLLNCNTYMGELSRMTQYKDKSAKQGENIRAALFDYPVLMAADILLYQPHYVPVGDDQRQHIELCRDVANRFNNAYSDTFIIPEGYYPQVGARIMSLSEPTGKMSKSDSNENGYISLKDNPDVIMRKFKRAVTDSDASVRYDEKEKPGISNLLQIYASSADVPLHKAVEDCAALSYADFKVRVAEAVIESLRPIQDEFERLMKDKKTLEEYMSAGANKAEFMAKKTLKKVQKKMGLVLKK